MLGRTNCLLPFFEYNCEHFSFIYFLVKVFIEQSFQKTSTFLLHCWWNKFYFLFNSNRWKHRVLSERPPFFPRYTHIYPGSCGLIFMFAMWFLCLLFICICVYMQMANLADVDVPEEDKINLLIKQSTYDSMKWVSFSIYLSPEHISPPS